MLAHQVVSLEIETPSTAGQIVRASASTRRNASRVARWIAVCGGAGYSPFAPGSVGALLGVAGFLAYAWISYDWPQSLRFWVLAAMLAVATGIGTWAAGLAERGFDRQDDNRIVIDEFVGQLLALLIVVRFARQDGSEFWGWDGIDGSGGGFFSILPWIVTGFVLFRVFDIAKPGPVGWAERRFHGGWGVMADDLVAGLLAGLVLLGMLRFAELLIVRLPIIQMASS